MRISDWSSDVCSSDLLRPACRRLETAPRPGPLHPAGRADLRQTRGGRHLGLWPAGGRAPYQFTRRGARSEEHTSELQSLMRISYAVFCLKKKKTETRENTSIKHTAVNTTNYSKNEQAYSRENNDIHKPN